LYHKTVSIPIRHIHGFRVDHFKTITMSAEEVAAAPAVEKPEDAVASDQAEQAEQADGEVAEEPKAVASMSLSCI
jgi:hypothetical protein